MIVDILFDDYVLSIFITIWLVDTYILTRNTLMLAIALLLINRWSRVQGLESRALNRSCAVDPVPKGP